ncbi:MAG: AMP-binding protein, partial [Candidatus Sulfotelmatobacter sp.]
MAAAPESNFGARLVERLGPHSRFIDAATRSTIGPGQLPRLIAAYGASLISAGLNAGDRILIGCALSPSSALVYLGAIYAGLVAVPVDERTLIASASSLVDATGAKAVWSEAGMGRDGTVKPSALCLEGDLARDVTEIMPPAVCAASDLAALMATSGSTGVPRFVQVSHQNLIANTEAIVRSQGLTDNEIAMLILPVSYCFGASLLHSHLYQGGAVVFDRRFMFLDKVLQAVAEYGCTT